MIYKLGQLYFILKFMLKNHRAYGIGGIVWTVRHYWKTTKVR